MPNNVKKISKSINPLNGFIQIKNAKVHNLKSISINIPRNKFIVITGLSGSGKSSLAFDTLYAEGQRRYVESLSSYARQFLGRINKPEVDYIKGIPPAIAIEQKVNTRNPRSTVGTSTEIYDYFKLLFAKIGKTFSPISGNIVKRHSISDVVTKILSLTEGTKFLILTPLITHDDRTLFSQLDILLKQGYTRVEIVKQKSDKEDKDDENENIEKIETLLASLTSEKELIAYNGSEMRIVIDRLKVAYDDDTKSRIADSVQTAFYEGKGDCVIKTFVTTDDNQVEVRTIKFSNKFEADGIIFEDPTVHTFSFNNPVGACPKCEGFGQVVGIDEKLVVPNQSLSVYQDAIACWKGEKLGLWKEDLIYAATKFDFPIHKPFTDLTDKQKTVIWEGNKHFRGLNEFFKGVEEQGYKIQNRVLLSRYRGKTICSECKGTRLKKEASYIKVNDKSIHDLVMLSIEKLKDFFDNLQLSEYENEVSRRILIEINNRISFLLDVGLGYLTLNRLSSTLSGGESQRINLATSLGSSLVGSLYILDEPSIGLHSRDSERLIKVLRHLQKIGNTVIVVEHDEDIIKAADEIIDIGPLAGINGGEVIFQGDFRTMISGSKSEKASLTIKYITGQMNIPVPQIRRPWNNYIEVIKAKENNLKNVSVKFPLYVMTVVTGVSGSGKSTLVNKVLYAALNKHYSSMHQNDGQDNTVKGDKHLLTSVEFVNQNPIGKSSRSNPVTYIKAYDDIRKLFAEQQASKINNYKPGHFSFNVDGGRCEECQGEGEIKVEMQFMADVHLLCDSCKGKRFKEDILNVKYEGKSIFDILDFTVDEAFKFFTKYTKPDIKETKPKTTKKPDRRAKKQFNYEKKIAQKLQLLVDVGLGYVKLGQSSNTLSGGESQRIKLASFLSKESDHKSCMFIFDEPTTGLHFHDIQKLIDAFNALIAKGHSLVVIEHNHEIIKSADWVVDLGPEGGEQGGEIIFEGTPENLVKCKASYTGKYLKEKL